VALGADVVAADVDDVGSLERGFSGAHGAYCVTFSSEHCSPDREKAQASNLAHAAAAAGVRHAIWSTFEDTRKYVPLSDPRMPHPAGRLQGAALRRDGRGGPRVHGPGRAHDLPADIVLLGELDLLRHGAEARPRRGARFHAADGRQETPGIATEDIGRFAHGLFKAGGEFVGSTVGVAGEHLTGAQMAASLARALGQTVRYNAVPPDVYRGFGFPGADDLGNMFQFKAEFESLYCGHRDLALVHRLNPAVQTFDRWLTANARRIPLE